MPNLIDLLWVPNKPLIRLGGRSRICRSRRPLPAADWPRDEPDCPRFYSYSSPSESKLQPDALMRSAAQRERGARSRWAGEPTAYASTETGSVALNPAETGPAAWRAHVLRTGAPGWGLAEELTRVQSRAMRGKESQPHQNASPHRSCAVAVVRRPRARIKASRKLCPGQQPLISFAGWRGAVFYYPTPPRGPARPATG